MIEFTQGERTLLRLFSEYLDDIFDHGAAKPKSPLCDRVALHVIDDIDVASEVATDEGEMAAYLCRRAHHWHHLAKELTQFLDAKGHVDLQALPTFKSLVYSEELRRRHGSLFGAADETELRKSAVPPVSPASTVRTPDADCKLPEPDDDISTDWSMLILELFNHPNEPPNTTILDQIRRQATDDLIVAGYIVETDPVECRRLIDRANAWLGVVKKMGDAFRRAEVESPIRVTLNSQSATRPSSPPAVS